MTIVYALLVCVCVFFKADVERSHCVHGCSFKIVVYEHGHIWCACVCVGTFRVALLEASQQTLDDLPLK